MMKKLLTSFTPGAVLRICRLGRSTSPVEWHAPETMPSARPVFTMSTPKNSTSRTFSAACSRVMPLCLRSSYRVFANSSCRSESCGSISVAPSSARPDSLMAATLPRMIRFATPWAKMVSAASSVRGSSPSGSTMVCLSALARSSMVSKNELMFVPFLRDVPGAVFRFALGFGCARAVHLDFIHIVPS